MKLVFKQPESEERFSIKHVTKPCLDVSWHYHACFELMYIKKSSGIRFVGDSVSQFVPGDLVLVGPYVPHLWRSDAKKKQQVDKYVFRFSLDFISADTFGRPEFAGITSMLKQADKGLAFGPTIASELHAELAELTTLPAAFQLIKFLEILYRLSRTSDKKVLSVSDMRKTSINCSKRIDKVLKYVSDNYSNDISLEEVADIACMTTNSFCRSFKRITQKSFTQFLNEVRVRNATRMLAQGDKMVGDVSFEVGYHSVESFRKWFKVVMGVTPSDFRQAI